MGKPDIAAELAARCPGFTQEDIASAVSASQFPFVDSPAETVTAGSMLCASESDDGGGQGGVTGTGFGSDYPEAFKCYYEDDEYKIQDPYVCTPSGTVYATGSVTGPGSYYCVVKKESSESGGPSTYSAEITGEPSGSETEGERVVAEVPLFDIMSNGEIHQHHLGAIVVTGGEGSEPADGSGLEINESGELDLDGRESGDVFGVHDVTGGDSGTEVVAKVLSTSGFGLGLDSANGVKGTAHVIGGPHIKVETEGQTIKISYDEDKEDPDPDPEDPEKKDPCTHPGDKDNEGGVSADGDGGGTGGGGGGGVPAGDGDTHTGDSGCESCK